MTALTTTLQSMCRGEFFQIWWVYPPDILTAEVCRIKGYAEAYLNHHTPYGIKEKQVKKIRDWIGSKLCGLGFLIMTDDYFDGIIIQIRKEAGIKEIENEC